MRTCLPLRLSQEDERAWHIRLADVRMCVCGHRGLSGDSNLGSAILWLHSPEQGPLPLWAQFSHQAFWGPLLGFGAPRGCSSQFRLGKCRWNEQTHGRKNEGMNEAVPLPSTAGLAQEDGGGRGASGKIRPRTARAWPRMPRTPRRWWGLLLNLAGRAKNSLRNP